MNYVYIVAGSKFGTVMLKLAREGPFYGTWHQSNVYCTRVPRILGPSFYIFTQVI